MIIRCFDIVLSLLAILAFSPVMILISILIIINDRGPVFFQQPRVGQNLTAFRIIKFRSMTVDKTRSLGQEVSGSLEDKQRQREAYQTTAQNDTRVTRIGKFLRATHLDELPQLFNVLRGDMSLVGVRPDAFIQEVDYTKKNWRKRHVRRPGITGPAQIDPNITSLRARFLKDMIWVENGNLILYWKILIGTVRKVFKSNSF